MDEALEMKQLFMKIRAKMAFINIRNIINSGLTMSQASIIGAIGANNGLSLKMLSALVGLDNSTVSRSVNQLVEKELVVREPLENDKRMIQICLSEKGLLLYDRMERSSDEQYEKIIRNIPQDKLASFMESAALMLEAVEKFESESRS